MSPLREAGEQMSLTLVFTRLVAPIGAPDRGRILPFSR
jgi:hypothetical protein